MKEHDFNTNEQAGAPDLEQRLRAYYGPQLREQPLSQASWQHLRLRLGTQEGAPRRRRFHWRPFRKRSRAFVPTSVQEAFTHIVYEAGVPATPQSMLRCSTGPLIHEPAVHSSWLGRYHIRLLLPLNALMTMGKAELDVLLATGLARCIGARKPPYSLGRFLLAALPLLACVALILFWLRHLPLIGLLVALLLCAALLPLWQIQARSLAFNADKLIVFWLGRSRVCSGLHALADRSRSPGRRRWGEPSLTERIERVCGTRVETRSNELTLVG